MIHNTMAAKHYILPFVAALLLTSCNRVEPPIENQVSISPQDIMSGIGMTAEVNAGNVSIILTGKRGDFTYVARDVIYELWNKSKPAQKYLKEIKFGHSIEHFIDATIEGEIQLTASIPLCGRVPGENLADLAKITHLGAHFKGLVCKYPEFDVINSVKIGDSLVDYLAPGCYMSFLPYEDHIDDPCQLCASLENCLNGLSEESFTLSLDVPIYGESWYSKYKGKYSYEYFTYGDSYEPVGNRRTLHGEVVIIIP